MGGLLKKILAVAITLWFFGYVSYSFMQQIAEIIAIDLRGKYLRALLKQEVSFFEMNNVEQMPTDIGQYFGTISQGVGEAFGQLLNAAGTFIGGISIALYNGPVFTCVCIAYMPIIMVFVVVFGAISKVAQFKKLGANQALGGFTEETLSSLKLIVSFAQEKKAVEIYDQKAAITRDISKDANTKGALVFGIIRTLIFGFFVFTFYIATVFVEKGVINPNTGKGYNITEIVSITQAMIMSMMQLLSVIPNITTVSKAQVVGRKVFDVLERTPQISNIDNIVNSDGFISLKEGISFKGVHFRYPTCPETQPDTLQGVNFNIKAGTSTAIVGPSGSGKSTIVQMIERFYDPKQGEIFMDEKDLKGYSLHQLRNSIGYVSQEPVLILGTIRENLLHANNKATQQDIEEALRKANAGFVNYMENGLDTYIGSSSVSNLSGGQKQRIAIARALIKNPKILILDEATSALDPKSEGEVQKAIDQIQKEE